MDDTERTLSEKLSGRIRRPEDAGGKRLLQGMVFRSPIRSGRIASIELPEAPSGLFYVTAHDIPGHAGITVAGTAIPLLVKRDIHWKGQPILVACGADPEETAEWMSRIVVDARENAPEGGGETPRDREVEWMRGDAEGAFSSAFQVVEESFDIPGGPRYGTGGTVTCVRDGASYTIHAATPWPGALRRHVSKTLGIERENVTVRPYAVGPGSGALGGMWSNLAESCRASLLSWKSRKSVRIDIAPNESSSIGESPGGRFHLKGAVDADGRVLALEADFTLHAGAYLPLEEEVLNRIALGLIGIAPIRNYRIRGKVVYGGTPPSDLGPAAGFELGFLAGELFASRVSEYCLIAPGDWRRSSLPAGGQAFGPGLSTPKDFPLPTILEKALSASDFERKNAACEQSMLARGNLSEPPAAFNGVGMSCAWFGNGFLGSPRELGSASVSATLGIEGDLEIAMPPYVTGGALIRAWINIARETLGVEESAVKFSVELPPSNVDPGPALLGVDVSVYTKLLDLVCNDLAKRRFRDALPITATRSRRRTAKRPKRPEPFEGIPFEAISWGVCVVETRISTETLEATPLHLWLFLDGGQLLMQEHARAAVEAEAERALDWCLGRTPGRELPLIDVAFYDSGSKRASKDVSSLPWLLVPAACVRSVRQASGVDLGRIPITPELIRNGGFGR